MSLFEHYQKAPSCLVGLQHWNGSAQSFLATRSRNTDPDTSKEAAKAAITSQSSAQRLAIGLCVKGSAGLTTSEIADLTGIKYEDVKRRVSECGLTRTALRRDTRLVWVA